MAEDPENLPNDSVPTDPVEVSETLPVDPDTLASASRVGPPTGESEPLPGTDSMGAETGGLAGTSR